MNFSEFCAWRNQILANAPPKLLDLGETRLTNALGELRPRIDVAAQTAKVHRCHLAEDWLALFERPASWKTRLFVSRGVRHSLSLLFSLFAERGFRLLLPNDVYPVYFDLAREAGCQNIGVFETIPTPSFEQFLASDAPEVMVLPNPLKPLGRFLEESEVAFLKAWLHADTKRRLILDTVYTFDTRLHPVALELEETGQVLLLHSLSKGWLSPLIFGVALVPESDVELVGDVFRANSPTQSELFHGQQLLHYHTEIPHHVREVLAAKQKKTRQFLEERGLQLLRDQAPPGYLATVSIKASVLWNQHQVLAIPASAFGSARKDWSVLSTLSIC